MRIDLWLEGVKGRRIGVNRTCKVGMLGEAKGARKVRQGRMGSVMEEVTGPRGVTCQVMSTGSRADANGVSKEGIREGSKSKKGRGGMRGQGGRCNMRGGTMEVGSGD